MAGKFFDIDGSKFIVHGVTYGPLCENGADGEYHNADMVRRDFSMMVGSGINTVRTYTVPPKWFLDLAGEYGLRVMVGIAWEQHVAFLESAADADRIEHQIRQSIREGAGHPAVFGYSIGNEIPSTVVRWYGHRKVEKFIQRQYLAAKNEDPQALVTYVNYPSTEYLELPFLDFLSFNIFLESPNQFKSYLSRLQTIAGDRPMVMSEIGLDARRHGAEAQALTLGWQVRSAIQAGCAGVFVFSWTDEWYRGGEEIRNWEFGLTTRQRQAKPALAAVGEVFRQMPFSLEKQWPGISVVVCTHNGSSTLRWCLDGLCAMQYPNFEVVLIDDGSTDQSAAIASEYADRGVRLIRTPNHGLSSARNQGMNAAAHDIVAYLDDDARPDPHWLFYLADSFQRTGHAGIGGPNIPPVGDAFTAQAVALAPGGPVHVLLTDEVAEHIPGCNMAFRKTSLLAVGGFDPQFRIAGDDVDLCWRLQDRGLTLGFNPAAMVWHRRRKTVKAYLKQQFNYGRSEADLEHKWPEKYNAIGHLTWAGRLYRSNGLLQAINWWARRRIYHGTWGSAMFQSVYHAPPNWIWSVPSMPEWYLLIAILGTCGALGRCWSPLYAFLPLCMLAAMAPAWHAIIAAHASVTAHPVTQTKKSRLWAMVAVLQLLQPLSRLAGRISRGLTPWRSRKLRGFRLPHPIAMRAWNADAAKWKSHERQLCDFEAALISQGAVVARGGDFDPWDIEVRGGTLGSARMRVLVEEHGNGKQLFRLAIHPRWSPRNALLALVVALVAGMAAVNHGAIPAIVFGVTALATTTRALYEAGTAVGTAARVAAAQGFGDLP